jgi:hypothetical protein
MGNYHAQFLGGLGSAMTPGYPVFGVICDILGYHKFSKAWFSADYLNKSPF